MWSCLPSGCKCRYKHQVLPSLLQPGVCPVERGQGLFPSARLYSVFPLLLLFMMNGFTSHTEQDQVCQGLIKYADTRQNQVSATEKITSPASSDSCLMWHQRAGSPAQSSPGQLCQRWAQSPWLNCCLVIVKDGCSFLRVLISMASFAALQRTGSCFVSPFPVISFFNCFC